jgi:hypothetical protein
LPREPRSAEDGILSALEIAKLRVNAGLVVLSGCITADGRRLELSRLQHFVGFFKNGRDSPIIRPV